MIALFVAGGSGIRLWPLSQENNPKQLHSLIGDKSLMQQSIERVTPLIEPHHIWIVTGADYAERIAENSPEVLPEQIISEPFPLGTNLAVGLGLIHIVQNNPEATIVVGWADSFIGKEPEFRRALQRAAQLVEEADGIILSVPVAGPSTAHGYIKTGEPVAGHAGAFKITNFEEKPNRQRAQELLNDSSYYWNTGISIWRASKLLALFEKHQPDHYSALHYVGEAIGTSQDLARMKDAFQNLDRLSIDQAIFEKATNLATIPVDLDWSDAGSWSAVYDIQSVGANNVTRGAVVTIETEKCLIFAQKHLIATLGISDLIIVENEGSIIIVHKDEAHRLKELHEKVAEFNKQKI